MMTNHRSNYNRISRPHLAIVTMLLFSLTTVAQQPTKPDPAKSALPAVEDQLKVLTEKLDLTGDQQAKIKPMLQELHDITLKFIQDDTISQEERLAKVRPLRYKTGKRMREVLSTDQKKKLDVYEQGPHPEMHGALKGTPPTAQ